MRESEKNLSEELAKIALALADAGGLDDTCNALENERLRSESTGPVRASISRGSSTLEKCICALQDLWKSSPALTGREIATALRVVHSAERLWHLRNATPQVVWTGPKVQGSFLRSTREIIREILRSAQRDVLVVGYWIAAREDGEGIIEEVIDLLAGAVRREIAVTIVVDERQRADGRDNRQILLEAWPRNVREPRILTWRLPENDVHLKLHAKLLVADSSDALVTSANLTMYAMDRNIEMGVRVFGNPAGSIADHFDRLIDCGVLENYDQEFGSG